MIFIIAFSTFLVLSYSSMVRYFFYYLRQLQKARLPEGSFVPGLVSVVIPFRNEQDHLESLLNGLAGQSLSPKQWEVILINDHSSDKSVERIKAFKLPEDLSLRLLHCPEGIAGKKKALQYGLAECRGEFIIQTDADCRLHPNWLQNMGLHLQDNTSIVLGMVNMVPRPKFWPRFAALEFMSLQASGAAMCAAGKPIMGSAANMLFRKSAWEQFQNEGTARDSGDDVFLIQAVARSEGGAVIFSVDRETIVETFAPSGFREFILQRSRWGAKTPDYLSRTAQGIALLVASYSVLTIVLLIAGFWNPNFWLLACGLYIAKGVNDYFFLRSYAHQSGQQKLMQIFIPAALLYPFYIFITGIYIVFSPQNWKGRAIR